MQSSGRKIDSVRKRYLVTLFSNTVFFFASLVTAGIVPRALGPKQLGDFSFLSRVSSAFRRMLDMSASSAFFNYNSKHERSGALVKVYSVWLLGELAAIITLILLAFLIGLKDFIWPGQQLKYILWVAVFDWVFFIAAILRHLGDSKGYTAKAQLINLSISLINIFVLVFFALKGFLNLGRYIAIQTLTSAVVSLGIVLWIVIPHRDIYLTGKIKGKLKGFAGYFYKFCSPLVVITIVGFVFEYFDRVVLQKFSGSINQGYFHIASSWAAFATLFTTSILSIYKREMANALGKSDTGRASGIFSRYLKMMYFLTLVMAIFLAFHARTLLGLIAGSKFIPATAVVIIMAFYPIHQAYGQLGGATFYASERTALLRNISVVAMLSGIPLTYLFLAPSHLPVPGLGLGAKGLAVKTVIWNLVVVQIYLIHNCRFFKLNPRSFWWHQIYSVVILAAIMFVSKGLVGSFMHGTEVTVLISKLAVEVIFYFSLVACLVYFFPRIAGVTREEVLSTLRAVKSRVGWRNEQT